MSVEHSTITNQNEQKLTNTLRLIVEGIQNKDLPQLQKIELEFDNMVIINTLEMSGRLHRTFQNPTYSMDC